MLKNFFKLSFVAVVCFTLAGCLSLGGLSYKQAKILKKEGFVLTEDGWSLGLPERLLFDFNESEIKPNNVSEITRLAQQLQKYNLDKVKVVGHTDNVGSAEYNLKLSEQRADKVAQIFITQRFNPQNIHIVGKGSEQPIVENDTEEHRAENRRVAIIIIP